MTLGQNVKCSLRSCRREEAVGLNVYPLLHAGGYDSNGKEQG